MVNCKLFSWPNLELKIVSDYHVIETQPDSDSGDGQWGSWKGRQPVILVQSMKSAQSLEAWLSTSDAWMRRTTCPINQDWWSTGQLFCLVQCYNIEYCKYSFFRLTWKCEFTAAIIGAAMCHKYKVRHFVQILFFAEKSSACGVYFCSQGCFTIHPYHCYHPHHIIMIIIIFTLSWSSSSSQCMQRELLFAGDSWLIQCSALTAW